VRYCEVLFGNSSGGRKSRKNLSEVTRFPGRGVSTGRSDWKAGL
jgi:hypothetical protein